MLKNNNLKKLTMKKIILFFVLMMTSFIFFNCSSDDDITNSTSNPIEQKLIGKWYIDGSNSTDVEPNSYTFKGNKTVSYKYYVSSEGWRVEDGTWILEGNKLTMKFIEDGVELIMIHTIEINDSGIMKMTSLDGNGYNQNFYKSDNENPIPENNKLLPAIFRNLEYKYDKNNRIQTIIIPNAFIANITYSGDLISEVSEGWYGNVSTKKFIYNDGGEILVYDTNNKLQNTLVVKNNLLISEKNHPQDDNGNIYKFEYDDKGNLIKDYYIDNKENTTNNIIVFSSYTYDLTQEGIFREVKTPRWIIAYLFGHDEAPFFSSNLVKKTDYEGNMGGPVYDIIWEDYQYGYPKKYTENIKKGNGESHTFDIVYKSYTK